MTEVGLASAPPGVQEQRFELQVDGERVPAVLWTPLGATGPRPLVLMGHGGGQHKRADSLLARARRYALRHGYATLAIDAQGHGERAPPEETPGRLEADIRRRAAGARSEPSAPSPLFKTMKERARRIVGEWRAALDAAQVLPTIGQGGPVGYWGISMGTVLGVPLLAAEPRIRCAVLGLGGVRPGDEAFRAALRAIAIPVHFTAQWDDVLASRAAALELFETLPSPLKAMHIHPGGHTETPAHEEDAWEAFFVRHLEGAPT